MVQVYLGIGSNLNRQQNIALAIARLKKEFAELHVSPVYESRPVDSRGGNYYNLAVGFRTAKSLPDLRSFLHDLERALGRNRGTPGQVTIDLDLLVYGDLHGEVDGCRLPHPDLARYRHILQPLVDIAGERSVPGRQIGFRDLLKNSDLAGHIEKVRG
jgi:2-amino-4-hydroxy-6-hydroxymethyldihydropteridine diphosphokinase